MQIICTARFFAPTYSPSSSRGRTAVCISRSGTSYRSVVPIIIIIVIIIITIVINIYDYHHSCLMHDMRPMAD